MNPNPDLENVSFSQLPSPCGRGQRGGVTFRVIFHPHPNPLPSREKELIRISISVFEMK
jgi:hypothetical protein